MPRGRKVSANSPKKARGWTLRDGQGKALMNLVLNTPPPDWGLGLGTGEGGP